MYRLYHSLLILVLFSIIYCDEISSEYIEPSLIFKELIKHDIGTNERDTSDFFQNIILTQIEQNINNELSHLVNPDNILLKKTGETVYIYRFDYDDSLKAMNSEELLDSLESFAYYFWKGKGSADISEKGFKNYIYPSFYDEFITKYKNLFEKFQSTHVDLDENTAYNNFINNLELFNNEKENLLQNVKYFLSWSTRYYYTIYVDKTISTSIFSPLKNIIYDLYPHTKDCIECIGIISTNLDSMLLADGIKQKTVLLNREDIYDDSWAVIIGIDKYENLSNLDYAVADAEAVQDMLVSKFDYKEENIKLLLNEEANKTNIVNVISDVSLNAGKNDRILIFYSGHGETMHLPDGGEMGYLLPIDGSQDNLFASAIPMDDLTDFSNMSKAKHMLFLVDACYGGLAAVGTKSLDAKKTPNYIEKITNRKSRQIITAGGKTEKVIEKSEWGHSAFTKNLLSALGEWYADSNSDSYITADELGDYLSEKVTIDSENQQTPQSRRLTSHEGEFIFMHSENAAVIQSKSADKTIIDEKIEDVEDKQSINKYKYQITASTTLESLALDKKSERQLRSGGILAVSGFLFFIDAGSSSSNNILKVVGVIGGGIGILYYLAIKSKAEKKYDSIKDIDNKDEKEGLAYNHLVFLADEAKRKRQYLMVTHGSIGAYSLLGGAINQYKHARFEDKNLYNGLFNGALALYHYKVLSKEEKALENINQP